MYLHFDFGLGYVRVFYNSGFLVLFCLFTHTLYCTLLPTFGKQLYGVHMIPLAARRRPISEPLSVDLPCERGSRRTPPPLSIVAPEGVGHQPCEKYFRGYMACRRILTKHSREQWCENRRTGGNGRRLGIEVSTYYRTKVGRFLGAAYSIEDEYR